MSFKSVLIKKNCPALCVCTVLRLLIKCPASMKHHWSLPSLDGSPCMIAPSQLLIIKQTGANEKRLCTVMEGLYFK